MRAMAENNNIPQFVTNESFMADKNYVKWLSDLKKRIRIAQLKAAVRVNEEMLRLYWSMGEDICEKQKQHHWGTAFMDRLSFDLRTEFPHTEGFSRANLYFIKRWFCFILHKWSFSTKLVENTNGRKYHKSNAGNPPSCALETPNAYSIKV